MILLSRPENFRFFQLARNLLGLPEEILAKVASNFVEPAPSEARRIFNEAREQEWVSRRRFALFCHKASGERSEARRGELVTTTTSVSVLLAHFARSSLRTLLSQGSLASLCSLTSPVRQPFARASGRTPPFCTDYRSRSPAHSPL